MSKKVFLISEKTLKEDSLISDNVGNEYIRPAITEAQDIDLQEIIGTKLLNKICNLVSTGDIIKEENISYKELLDDYITPYLEWKVMSTIQIPLAYKMRNMGIVQTNDTNVYSSTLRDAEKLMQHYDGKASFYSIRLTKFLCANTNKYPEYCSTDSSADFKGGKNNFYIPTYLG